MTLCEKLVAHKGGLLLLKTELWWYGGRGWDGCPGRICLLMDAATDPAATSTAVGAGGTDAAAVGAAAADAAALLLLDGHPRWVWVAQEDVALL
jgi:hypothetical protein